MYEIIIMGFFDLLESFFFVSLAITFVLIVMLVYHFKERLVGLEKKNDTMFHILNNMIKELKSLQESRPEVITRSDPPYPVNVYSAMFGTDPSYRSCQIEEVGNEDEESDADSEEEEEKVLVLENEDPGIKIINIDMTTTFEDSFDSDNDSTVDEESAEKEALSEEPQNDLEKPTEDTIDYKRMDINNLRELAVSRGLTTDAKKMKKADLIKLLSEE